ncbi:TetR/AcrR family transcriptional regulator C-terminal domain-containing protein [Kitasatospora brasiliensis]|uniref:TetR/AcrR family transcriptional regulator C-terminal domain-containing protein n=1 Tax=Kitasatospora brasiliensis TaxID=3058040 RepID=UPI00293104D2|nr:TetR/AcrR family transcriptional regulator C-terminal domain-containing protein [Kitasatospora sp. K002]
MAAKSENGTTPGIPMPWNRPQRKREQPSLSRDQIVAEAFALLDANGIEALSMRKLAARLNAGATSLYTHVANKEELLALVVDQIFGTLPLPEAEGSEEPKVWRAKVMECAESMRAAITRHPWMVGVIGDVGMIYLGPNWMRLCEAQLAVMETAGFEFSEANEAMNAVVGYTIGTACVEASWLASLARSGQDEQEWMNRLLPTVIEATKDFPRLHRLYTTEVSSEVEAGRDNSFTRGVNVILDGIEATMNARRGR